MTSVPGPFEPGSVRHRSPCRERLVCKTRRSRLPLRSQHWTFGWKGAPCLGALPLLRSYPRNGFPFPSSCIPQPQCGAATGLRALGLLECPHHVVRRGRVGLFRLWPPYDGLSSALAGSWRSSSPVMKVGQFENGPGGRIYPSTGSGP